MNQPAWDEATRKWAEHHDDTKPVGLGQRVVELEAEVTRLEQERDMWRERVRNAARCLEGYR